MTSYTGSFDNSQGRGVSFALNVRNFSQKFPGNVGRAGGRRLGP